jgi:hypothetical protein
MSRTYDTDVVTLRTVYTINPLTNIPLSSQSLSYIGEKGVVSWASPDSWASTLQLSTLNCSLYTSLSNSAPITFFSTISTQVSLNVASKNYATVPQLTTSFITNLGVFNVITQQILTNQLRGNISTYTSYTSTYTTSSIHLQASAVGGFLALSTPICDFTEMRVYSRPGSQFEISVEPNLYVDVATGKTEPLLLTQFLTLADATVIGNIKQTTFTSQQNSIQKEILTWAVPLEGCSSILLNTQISTLNTSLATYTMAMNFPDTGGAKMTVNNSFTGTYY